MADTEPRSVFDLEPDETEEARLDAEAMYAFRTGRVVPHTKVVEWLKSWEKPDELACPRPE